MREQFSYSLNHFVMSNLFITILIIYFAGSRLVESHRRFQSSYIGSFGRHSNDPESVIRNFESQPALHSSPAAVVEYVKALVKVDRLDESELLRTLQRGVW